MSEANPAQATGPMTLEQGVAKLTAKLADKKATIDDAVIVHPDDPNEETPEAPVEGEETAAEDNAEAVSETESQDAKEEPDNRPVILPDGSEITVEEARKGYLRQADYTRKTQDIARERESLATAKQVEIKKVSDLYQQLQQFQEAEPNWLELARDPNTDPKQLQAAQLWWQQRKSVMAKAQQEVRDAEINKLRSQKAAAFQVLNEGRFDATWKDPKVLKSALDKVANYLIDRGIPGDVLEGISNPTFIEIAEESRRYREAMANKPKATLAVKGKPAPIKPGAKSTASPQSENIRLLNERFRKNPTIDNATALTVAKSGGR